MKNLRLEPDDQGLKTLAGSIAADKANLLARSTALRAQVERLRATTDRIRAENASMRTETALFLEHFQNLRKAI